MTMIDKVFVSLYVYICLLRHVNNFIVNKI